MKHTLHPTIQDLKMECVLVQAWKKTAAHIRQHSWYADTIAFAEICPDKLINRPTEDEAQTPDGLWKSRPAGWKNPADIS